MKCITNRRMLRFSFLFFSLFFFFIRYASDQNWDELITMFQVYLERVRSYVEVKK